MRGAWHSSEHKLSTPGCLLGEMSDWATMPGARRSHFRQHSPACSSVGCCCHPEGGREPPSLSSTDWGLWWSSDHRERPHQTAAQQGPWASSRPLSGSQAHRCQSTDCASCGCGDGGTHTWWLTATQSPLPPSGGREPGPAPAGSGETLFLPVQPGLCLLPAKFEIMSTSASVLTPPSLTLTRTLRPPPS